MKNRAPIFVRETRVESYYTEGILPPDVAPPGNDDDDDDEPALGRGPELVGHDDDDDDDDDDEDEDEG